jgi:SlyX protein
MTLHRTIFQMPTPSSTELEARITELEIKLGFTEDLVEHINSQAARQQDLLALLQREVVRLSDQMQDNGPGSFRSLRDELPPHY